MGLYILVVSHPIRSMYVEQRMFLELFSYNLGSVYTYRIALHTDRYEKDTHQVESICALVMMVPADSLGQRQYRQTIRGRVRHRPTFFAVLYFFALT